MSLTTKFKSSYLKGFDCRLSTFRNNLACNGIVLSNAMTLGLSGSLIFCCNNGTFQRLPITIIAGISDQSLEGLSSRINCYLFHSVFDVNDDWLAEIQKYLAYNVPVNVAINRVRLQEILNSNGSGNPQLMNMGFHFITITDYNQEKKVFTIFETDSSDEIHLSPEELKEIWFYDVFHQRKTRDLLQSCNGQWYGIITGEFNDEVLIPNSINAIQKVLLNFYNSPHKDLIGEKALNLFFEEVNTWYLPARDPRMFSHNIKFLNLMNNNLSGGGMGRKLYSYFLNELSAKMMDEDLKQVSRLFLYSSKLWKEFISQLNGAIEIENNNFNIDYNLIKNLVHAYANEIVKAEINQMYQLKEWTKSKIYATSVAS
jgi:hypothetical protein